MTGWDRSESGSPAGEYMWNLARARFVGVLVVLLIVTGCSSSDDSRPEDAGSHVPIFDVDASTAARLELADGLALEVEPGDFSGAGRVEAIVADVEAPEVAGFVPFADPIELVVDGVVESDLSLTMTAVVPDEGVGIIFRHDDAEGWYPIAVADDTGYVSVDRRSFSPLSWGWIKVQDLSASVSNSTRQLLGKRHSPPDCPEAPPDWFAVDVPAVDVVAVCATTNADPDGNSARGEVRVVNNRGVVLEVQIPSGVAYAFVDGQPEVIREATREFTGRDSVLLAPGQLMTIGFTQPDVGSYLPLRVDYTPEAAIASVLLELVGTANGYAAIYVALAQCGLAPSPLDVRLDVPDLQGIAQSALACFSSIASDQQAAGTLAAETVALLNGVDTTVAISDQAMAQTVDKLAGNLRKAARAVAVISVGSDLIDATSDLYLNKELGDFNSLSPGITRRPRQVLPAVPPETAPSEEPSPLEPGLTRGVPGQEDVFICRVIEQSAAEGRGIWPLGPIEAPSATLHGPFVAGQPFWMLVGSSELYTLRAEGVSGPEALGANGLQDLEAAEYSLITGTRGLGIDRITDDVRVCSWHLD